MLGRRAIARLGRLLAGLPGLEPDPASGDAAGLTRDHVVWGYRLLLDRPPENEAVIAEKIASCRTTRDLRTDFIVAQEFRQNNPHLALFTGPTVVIGEIDGGLRLFLDLSDLGPSLAILRGEYERHEVALVRRALGPGQTALDLGANIGYLTVLMASLVGPGGHVHAFEPWARNADLLTRSVQENGFAERVTLHRAAVADRSGRGDLVVLDRAANAGGAYLDAAGAGAPSVRHGLDKVRLVALDDLDLPRPVSFVKIDVEGAEALALRGARRLLERDHPVVLSEINVRQLRLVSGAGPRELIAEMASLGYRCHALERAGLGQPVADVADVAGGSSLSVVFVPPGPSRPDGGATTVGR